MLWTCPKHPSIRHDESTLPADGKCFERIRYCKECGSTNIQLLPSVPRGYAACPACDRMVEFTEEECGMDLQEVVSA